MYVFINCLFDSAITFWLAYHFLSCFYIICKLRKDKIKLERILISICNEKIWSTVKYCLRNPAWFSEIRWKCSANFCNLQFKMRVNSLPKQLTKVIGL